METRVERRNRIKRDFKKKILGIPILIILYVISNFILSLSNIYITFKLSEKGFEELGKELTQFVQLAVLLSSLVCYANLEFLMLIVKSVFRLLLTVWIVLVITLSKLSSLDQGSILVLCTVFYVYFEVFYEINTYIYKKNDVLIFKMKIKKEHIQNYSIPTSIILVSIINILIAYPLDDFIKSI